MTRCLWAISYGIRSLGRNELTWLSRNILSLALEVWFFSGEKCSLIPWPKLEIKTIAWGLGPYILIVCPSRNLIMIFSLIDSARYIYSSMFAMDFPNVVDFVTKSYYWSEATNTTSSDNMIMEQPTYIFYWKCMSHSEGKETLYYSYAVA